jgi:tRNA nucleotidyltransferase (CCA-adding enzyme)
MNVGPTANVGRELSGLERFGPVLDALPGPAYLVGGTVRDLMLRRPPRFDFDLAIVGDAETYARDLAARLEGRVTTHGRFGTATVHYGDGTRVDVAAARTETYAAPAALPEVAPAQRIEDDLARRDFTVNAMAIALPDGRLIDPFGGVGHLRDRLVRVLHEESFVDDPTRIFRAARYEIRLGFRMDPKTETLALMAAPGVRLLSGARIREELFAIFEEDDPERVLARLHGLGVDAPLGVEFPAAPTGLQERLRELNDAYALGLPRWHLGLLSICAPEGWLDELKVVRRATDGVEAAHREEPFLRVALDGREGVPAEIVEAVERTGPDTALYALARAESPALRRYFEHLRGVRLEVDGDDLMALGLAESPRIGEVLAELRRRKLNGELAGRAEELAAARDLITE